MKIANFHCDLLSFLAGDPLRTAYDPQSHTSIPYFLEGNVVIETLVTYVQTGPRCSECGERQMEIYRTLPEKYPEFKDKIKTVFAIENASGFCSEEESLEEGIKRLERWQAKAGPIAYVSLTWNDENRFGGGNASKIGLKDDGKKILDWMSGKNIAIDLSHASDSLAYGIINHIDQKRLSLIPIASHSNFRRIANVPRNLPDDIALEIGKRGGIIGLNFVRRFLGSRGPSDFIDQINHASKLGLLNSLCFGADFFDLTNYPKELEYLKPIFLDGYENSSCYPQLLVYLSQAFSQQQLQKIAYDTLTQFLEGVS